MCKCEKGCKNNYCPCVKSNSRCTTQCGCTGCFNNKPQMPLPNQSGFLPVAIKTSPSQKTPVKTTNVNSNTNNTNTVDPLIEDLSRKIRELSVSASQLLSASTPDKYKQRINAALDAIDVHEVQRLYALSYQLLCKAEPNPKKWAEQLTADALGLKVNPNDKGHDLSDQKGNNYEHKSLSTSKKARGNATCHPTKEAKKSWDVWQRELKSKGDILIDDIERTYTVSWKIVYAISQKNQTITPVNIGGHRCRVCHTVHRLVYFEYLSNQLNAGTITEAELVGKVKKPVPGQCIREKSFSPGKFDKK